MVAWMQMTFESGAVYGGLSDQYVRVLELQVTHHPVQGSSFLGCRNRETEFLSYFPLSHVAPHCHDLLAKGDSLWC